MSGVRCSVQLFILVLVIFDDVIISGLSPLLTVVVTSLITLTTVTLLIGHPDTAYCRLMSIRWLWGDWFSPWSSPVENSSPCQRCEAQCAIVPGNTAVRADCKIWIGLSSVLRPRQHSIGYMRDGFYRSEDPTNSKDYKNAAQTSTELSAT